jgi:type I restriction enzyme, S subunit
VEEMKQVAFEQKNNLPEDWKIEKISNIIQDQLSGFACSINKLVKKDGYVHLRPFNLGNEGKLKLDILYQVPKNLVDAHLYFLTKGDILFNNTNSTELVGKSVLVDNDYNFAFSNHINRIRVKPNLILPEYFHYYLLFMFFNGHFLRNCKKWIGQSGYTVNNLKERRILLPPVTEQQKIVDKIDQMMVQNEMMKRESDKQIEAINKFFYSYSGKIFESEEVNSNGVKYISQICEKPQYGYTAASSNDEVGPKLLRITDIQNGNVNWDNVPYCICSNEDYKKYLLEDDDLVFARTGATTGKSYLIKNPKKAIFASYLIRLKVKKEEIIPQYLYLFFQSPIYWKKVLKEVRGGTLPNFNATMLSNLEVPVPLKEIQKAVVEKLNLIFKEFQNQTIHIEKQISAISQLPSSILNEVFGKYEIPEEE